MQKMKLKVTSHLNKRRKRLGFNKQGFKSFLEKAWYKGLRLKDLKSKPDLYKYMKRLIRPGYYPILYDKFCIVVSEHTHYGITVLKLNPKYCIMLQQILGGKPDGKRHSNRSQEEAEDGEESPPYYTKR